MGMEKHCRHGAPSVECIVCTASKSCKHGMLSNCLQCNQVRTKSMATIARTGWTACDPGSAFDIAKLSSGSLMGDSDVRAIPCPSAFNFVVSQEEKTWQSAVIVDYRIEYQKKPNVGPLYVVDIGIIEVGMPRVTHKNAGGVLVHDAQSIAVEAAEKAEFVIMTELALMLKAGIKFERTIRNQECKNLFKSLYKGFLNDILSKKYYAGKRVDVATVSFDDASFALQDKSEYRTLKFRGRDCR
ncbi:hypothetical protein [Cystobacter fuscus]|uniref:hypothetical protein n=1 Tax=Cystobacter fuscus TaxID=43 RepID=UPI0012DBD43E|nr:hypothetical protein [Cystobacter fuscus]